MPEISIKNYFDDAPIAFKGLSVKSEDDLAYLQDYAREHMSADSSQKIEDAIDIIHNPKSARYVKALALEMIEHAFTVIDLESLQGYLECQENHDRRWFYAQYGIYEAAQLLDKEEIIH